jgi:hypothetical protein
MTSPIKGNTNYPLRRLPAHKVCAMETPGDSINAELLYSSSSFNNTSSNSAAAI